MSLGSGELLRHVLGLLSAEAFVVDAAGRFSWSLGSGTTEDGADAKAPRGDVFDVYGVTAEARAAMSAIGETLGMMVANVPVVLFGDGIVQRLPLRLVRWLAACLFLGLGLVVTRRPQAERGSFRGSDYDSRSTRSASTP